MKLNVRSRSWYVDRHPPTGILVFVLRVWFVQRHLNFELRTKWIKFASWWKGDNWRSER